MSSQHLDVELFDNQKQILDASNKKHCWIKAQKQISGGKLDDLGLVYVDPTIYTKFNVKRLHQQMNLIFIALVMRINNPSDILEAVRRKMKLLWS